jgi:Cu+-exporting ATPase
MSVAHLQMQSLPAPGVVARPQWQRRIFLRPLASQTPELPDHERGPRHGRSSGSSSGSGANAAPLPPFLRGLAARFVNRTAPLAAASPFRRGLSTSLSVGAGISAVSTSFGGTGGGGGNGAGNGGGGNGGGGGGGEGRGSSPQGSGGSSAGPPQQVLGELADATADGAGGGEAKEFVIILDITGAGSTRCVGVGHFEAANFVLAACTGTIGESTRPTTCQPKRPQITGMKCGGCVGAVQRLLEGHPAVTSASVNLTNETALVRVRLAAGSGAGDAAAAAAAAASAVNPGSKQSGDSTNTATTATTASTATTTSSSNPALDALGRQLAALLDDGGFGARVRPQDASAWAAGAALASKRADREARLRRSTLDLAVAWGLSLLCGVGHLGHVWTGAPAWLHLLHHPLVSGTLSAAALLGPGREIMTSGFEGLMRGRPDMNTLVGMGAGASFGVSCAAAALPRLGWPTFFEEPAMLLGGWLFLFWGGSDVVVGCMDHVWVSGAPIIVVLKTTLPNETIKTPGFVLLGRALEERAKLAASSDMAALQGLVPTRARLLLTANVPAATKPSTADSDSEGAAAAAAAAAVAAAAAAGSSSGSWADVPAETVSPGDLLVVLPGDRIPVDGTVVGGRSTVDESALTGEPLPVTKAAGCHVTAGTLNCNGAVTVRAEASGQGTVIADIVRMVEAAQARTAPIQRLADQVAGKFAFGVMGLSAATFAFWATIGTRAFPGVVAAAAAAGAAGSLPACCAAAAVKSAAAKAAAGAAVPAAASLLLSLQLACNVLVVACPCALGLATPTAVLVGTAAGARRGLLVRGGDILETTAQVGAFV